MFAIRRRAHLETVHRDDPPGEGRTRRRALALIAVTAGVLAFAAPSALADDRLLDEDSVKTSSQGFDFGAGTLVFGGLTESATVSWLVDENKVTPVLTGELHLDGVDNECARMRIDYYTRATTYLITRYGGIVCADDNAHHSWTVDLAPHTSDKIGKIKVTLEHQLSNDDWAGAGSDWATLNTYRDPFVRVANHPNIKFGDNSWDYLLAERTGFGEVEWEFSEGQIRPHLTGTLHINNFAGACARMRIDYYADDGTLGLGPADTNAFNDHLETVYGGTVCAVDDSHYRWSVDRRDYSDYRIRYVEVTIEALDDDGDWTPVSTPDWSYFGT